MSMTNHRYDVLPSDTYEELMTTGIADAVWDEDYASHNTAGSFGKLLNTIKKANLAIEGTVSTAITPTTLTFSSNVVATTSAYAHAVLLFVSGPLAGENAPIVSYTNTNGVFLLEEPLTAAPSDGDEFVVIAASHVHTVAEIQSGLATTTQLTTVEGKIDTIDNYVDTEVAAIKATTDKLDNTLELDGAVYRFTANALELGPSGSSTITVSPLSAQAPERVVGTTIDIAVGDRSPVSVDVFDANDVAVDLSAQGNLEVCIESRNNTDLQVVAHASITIGGTGNRRATWTPNAAAVATVDKHRWSLRTESAKKVLAYGPWVVSRVALKDA
jgi:methylglyoxal synthase